MKHDLTTGTWQDDTGCPISFVLAATSDEGRRSYQFNTIVSCKVQWAERHKTASVKMKTTVVDMFDVPSSQGTTPSPGIQRGRKRDWGGSHRAEPHRGSRVSQGDDISYSSDES